MKTSSVLSLIELALLPALLIWHGFVMVKLWAWFVVPVFDAPELLLAQAIGVCLVVSFLRRVNLPPRNESEEDKVHRIGYTIAQNTIGPAITIGVAALVRLFQ